MKFTDAVKNAREKMIVEGDEYRQAVTIKLFNSVIGDTPILTGRLAGNWQTNEGNAKQGTTERTGSETAKQEVAEVVRSSKPDTVVHLTNNLPYSVPVEFGASGGMLRSNVARITQILRDQNK